MPHQYGLPGFAQSPPSPPSQHGALLPRIGGGAVVPGSTGSGSMTNTSSTAIYRLEDTRLTREAMERYMRDRNDKVIVILHAKVNKLVYKIQVHCFESILFAYTESRVSSSSNTCQRVYAEMFPIHSKSHTKLFNPDRTLKPFTD